MSNQVMLLVIPNLGTGGAQAVFRQQLAFYSARFKTVGVVFNTDGFTEADAQLNRVVSLDVVAGRNWPGKMWSFVARIRRLRAIKKQHAVTVSISHLEGADYVNWFSRLDEKVICWIHGTKMHDQMIRGITGAVRKRILMPYVYKRCDHIVTVSERIAEELRVHFKSRTDLVQTIYNGLNTDFIQAQAQLPVEPGFRKLCVEGTVVITHARLARQKNLHSLITIFSLVRNREKVKLVIVGDGEEMSSLFRHCAQRNLRAATFVDDNADADVLFMGKKENPFNYLRLASLFVLTSSWEGYPLSLCEALVCGLPVLASDCYTGPREIMRPDLKHDPPVKQPVPAEYGMLMPVPDDHDTELQWAETLSQVLADRPQLARWSEAAGRVRSTFSIARAESGWLKILE